MYYPELREDGNTRSMVNTWLGYNHNYNIGQGEFFDMENMSSDQYPLASVRKLRSCLTKFDEDDETEYMRGIIQVDDKVFTLWDTYLWDMSTDVKYDLSSVMDDEIVHKSEQTMLVMGSYLVIFPLNIYVSLIDPEHDFGKLGSSYKVAEGVTITYSPCNYSGSALQNVVAQDDAPDTPSHGDYWICTDPDKRGLYYYNGYQSTWEAVATSYVKISIPDVDLTDYFEEGDAIFMNTKLHEINEGSVIQKVESGYILVIGLMNKATDSEVTTSAWTLKLERKIPRMDYVCVHNNRIWGCHYGYDNISHKTVNEIYASKLGDFKNFYVYQGLSTDSYALTIGKMGQFTGCISFQGCPHFFKENAIYKIYGDYPAEYQMIESEVLGVQAGSSKSLAVVGNYLCYKSIRDVVIYDGSTPVAISQPLSRTEMFYDAIGAGCKDKYYIEMQNGYGGHRLFVYDVQLGLWMKETPCKFIQFSQSLDGQLYGITDHNLWGIGSDNNAVYTLEDRLDEEWVDFFAETGEIGYETPDKKYVSRITIRAFVPVRSEIEVSASYDDRPYDHIGTIRGFDDVATQSLAFAPFRCDHFKIRFDGHGDCRIYSMAITTEYGSEE